ncbi:MAG: ferrous iron transporter B [Fuerstiella sp.]|nr:ferrous iron transporter B [Fuerstiella sp.]MCP4856239.1 ferrous iron transporter B [Fuerstiella sp.]
MFRVALVGHPNTGKTTLFNRLTGLRARTANYPGITVDVRHGTWSSQSGRVELIDLPGMYSLDALSPEEKVARDTIVAESRPDVVAVVIDSTAVAQGLYLASEVRDLNIPMFVVLTLKDAATLQEIVVDEAKLGKELSCPIVSVSARTGEGIERFAEVLNTLKRPALNVLESDHTSCNVGCTGCTFAARYDWAEQTVANAVDSPANKGPRVSLLDRILTHPILGVLAFSALMFGVFYLIFSLAGIPMDLIDGAFGYLGDQAARWIPRDLPRSLWMLSTGGVAMLVMAGTYAAAGIPWTKKNTFAAVIVSGAIAFLSTEDFESLLVDGIIGGIGGVIIFLPQISILFFFISLLEDSGYMARAAFVMERLMRFVGLPGKAFVPMLSAHACAIPGIMAARVIESWRDRLVTILVLPFLTCSARLPVYAMVTALLFSDSRAEAAAAFVGAYLLGIVAALGSAWCLKKTVLKGDAVPLVIELPAFRRPRLRNAFLTVIDRATVFIRQAGTVILLISVVLWALATWPKIPESQLLADRPPEAQALEYSFAGWAGKLVEPVFEPLGFDWKINVGVMTSFGAREVVVSTLAIVYGIGEEAAEDEATLVETLRRQKREDGSPVFTTATGLSLLVFFVLAMQCLPTQAVTRRETGSWKWAVFQFFFMTAVAWAAAAATYQLVSQLAV